MFDLTNLIPKETAFEIYNNKDLFNSLSENEQRVTLQAVYFYDKELFAHDVTTRWVRERGTDKELPTPDFHKEIWDQSVQKKDVLCIIARDHAKTTAESKIHTLHELIYKTEQSILIIAAKGLGEKIVGDIKKELETNQKIKWLYGPLVPIDNRKDAKSEKWRQRYLQLLNGTELQSLSKGEPFRGTRPTKIKVDDPQSKKDVKNPAIADEFWNWFWTEVYPMLDDDGSCIVLATIISANCFAARLKVEAAERDFETIEYAAIIDFDEEKIRLGERNGRPWYFFDEGVGTSLWPEKWPMAALERRFNKIKRKAFLQEYQHIPFVENGSRVFDETYTYEELEPVKVIKEVNFYFDPEKEKPNAFIGIDLAKGASTGDFTTLVARDENYRLLADFEGHISQDNFARKIDEILIHFADYFIVPENNYGLAFLLAAESYEFYDKLYRQMVMDKVVKKETEVLGFNTNKKTKPLIIGQLEKKYESGTFQVGKKLRTQIDYYYVDERGGMSAISPHHDDLIIGDALSVHAVKHGLVGPQLIVF